MKVLFINQYYYPDTAATAQFLADVAEGLGKGFEVSVICGRPSYRLNNQPLLTRRFDSGVGNGVRVMRAWNTNFGRDSMKGRLANYLTFFSSAFLTALLRGHKSDLVYTKTDPPIIGLAGYLLSKTWRVPFIYNVTDVYPEIAQKLGLLRDGAAARLFDGMSRFLVQKADKTVALGHVMARRLIEKGAPPEKVVVIPDWAPTDVITPVGKRNPFSIQHQLSDKFVVLHSGNIGLVQDLENLVLAAELLRDHREIVFVIIGDGVRRPHLLRMVEERSLKNVRFIPYQETTVLKYSLGSADLSLVSLKKGLAGYILPSKIYGILASGRCVLAAVDDESEIAEIVRTERCGLIAQPGNPESLAQVILRGYEERDTLADLGKNGRRAAEEKYSLTVGIESYRRLFREIHTRSRV